MSDKEDFTRYLRPVLYGPRPVKKDPAEDIGKWFNENHTQKIEKLERERDALANALYRWQHDECIEGDYIDRNGVVVSDPYRELYEWREQYKRVMEERCPSDEHHCTCVPALRAEVQALCARVAKLEGAIQLVLDYDDKDIYPDRLTVGKFCDALDILEKAMRGSDEAGPVPETTESEKSGTDTGGRNPGVAPATKTEADPKGTSEEVTCVGRVLR